MIHLRQSTASQEVPLGHFVDSTDGVSAETALSIANTDIKVWKAGATTLANKNSGGATHISGGIYYCTLDATDTDTIGPLVLFVAVAGALAVRVECEVLDEAQYDALFGTTAFSTLTAAQVNTEADAALADVGLTGTVTGRLDAAVSSRLATSGYAAPLDAAGTRAAVGLASANLDTLFAAIAAYIDTEVAAIKNVTDLLPNGGALSSIATAAALSAAASDITTLLARLTSTRAGYIDNLSAGAVALEATLTAIKGGGWSTETLVAIAARLPAALTGSGHMKADTLAINGVAAAAVRLALSAGVIVPGTVDSTTFTPTTTVFESDDITTAAADHYIGRVIVFTSGTLINQATTITDYVLNGGRGRFTVDALTSAPANDVTFIII